MANTLKFKRGLVGTIPTAALGEPLFTTDTFDLYIGNGTGNTRFQKYIASGTTSQLLRGDGSLLTMPIVLSSPANGEVLKYNGTNWVNSSDAGITGSGIAGQVTYWNGTGTVTGEAGFTWDTTNKRLRLGSTGGAPIYFEDTDATSTFNVTSISNNGGNFNIETRSSTGTFVSADYQLVKDTASSSYHRWFTAASTERMRLFNTGNLVLNSTTDNGLRFQVTGDGYFSGSVGVGTSSPNTLIEAFKTTQAGSNEYLRVSAGSSSGNLSLSLYPATGQSYGLIGSNLTFTSGGLSRINTSIGGTGVSLNKNTIDFYTGSDAGNPTMNMRLDASGNLGLGVTPDQLLHIAKSSTTAYSSSSASLIQPDGGSNLLIQNTGTGGFTSLRFAPLNGSYAVGYIGFINTSGVGGSFVVGQRTGGSSYAEQMRLDASGNLGLGVTPSAWGTSGIIAKALQVNNVSFASTDSYGMQLSSNAYWDGSSWRYIASSFSATNYFQGGGVHGWRTAPSGTAGNAITFTQAMTLDASGRLGIGTASPTSKLDVVGSTTITNASGVAVGLNVIGYQAENFINLNNVLSTGNRTFRLIAGITSVGYNGFSIFDTVANDTRFVIHNTGNVGIGTTTDSGFKLDVNGTMRVSGASTFGGIMQIGSGVIYSGMPAFAQFIVGSRTTTDAGIVIQSTSTSISRLLLLNASDNGSIVRQDHSTGEFEIFNNGSKRFSIASTGAATFSSSVTATSFIPSSSTIPTNGIYLPSANTLGFATGTSARMWLTTSALGIGTASPQGLFEVSGAGVSYFTRGTKSILLNPNVVGADTNALIDVTSGMALAFGIGGTEGMRLTSTGLGIGMTPSYKLDVTGQARISDAIAIGTTPDTNLPFKILKNINSTVGIRFENTSTGNVAYSAVQFGTDVTGGTKFANLVYSSSGITESGAYKQNGTSIINTGTGGLNLLAVDGTIRFFTSSSNGTLRAEIANDGFINHYTGTAPSTNLTDGYRQYSADITAGNAAPHFRTENGGIIKLYQQTTGVTSATYIGGAGTTVTDLDTFDGYTIPQIVKALRNAGLLA